MRVAIKICQDENVLRDYLETRQKEVVSIMSIARIDGYRIKPWEELTIRDDYIFKRVMRRNKRLCRRMLEKILRIKIRDIKYLEDEKSLKARYQGKGIRLDVYVADDKGTVFNIEMQMTKPSGDGLYKRTRYYQSMIDIDLLAVGADYDELTQTFIIFICPFELFDGQRHMYTFRNVCLEDNSLELNDGATKIFLTPHGKLDDVPEDVKAFLAYIGGMMSDDDFVQEIEQEVQTIKQQEAERVSYMTFAMKMHDNYKAGQLDLVKSLLSLGTVPIEAIQQATGWSMERINELKAKGELYDFRHEDA